MTAGNAALPAAAAAGAASGCFTGRPAALVAVVAYLVNNGRVQVNDVLVCANNKQPAMLPGLLIGDMSRQQCTASLDQSSAQQSMHQRFVYV